MEGWRGGFAIEFDGNSYIEDDGGCLSKPEDCLSTGMTFKFSMKFVKFTNNMYIMTTGGDQLGYRGVAMYYLRKRIYLTVSTETLEWTVYTPFSKLNSFAEFEFTWGYSYGLQLFIDGKSVGWTSKYIRRTVLGKQSLNLRIGGPVLNFGTYCNVVFGGWQLWTAEKRLITAIGVNTGRLIFLLCFCDEYLEAYSVCSFLPSLHIYTSYLYLVFN